MPKFISVLFLSPSHAPAYPRLEPDCLATIKGQHGRDVSDNIIFEPIRGLCAVCWLFDDKEIENKCPRHPKAQRWRNQYVAKYFYIWIPLWEYYHPCVGDTGLTKSDNHLACPIFNHQKMVSQTTTPIDLLLGPSKDALKSKFVGKSLDGIRTPAFIVDRSLFAKNCASMHKRAEEWGATFRAHLKTHKVRMIYYCVPDSYHSHTVPLKIRRPRVQGYNLFPSGVALMLWLCQRYWKLGQLSARV